MMTFVSPFREYANRQCQLTEAARAAARQHSARHAMAMRYATSYEFLMGVSDDELRIQGSNKRSSGIRPGNGTSSSDPVYRKLSDISKNASAYCIWSGLDTPIQVHITGLQIDMEHRQMDEPTYLHILETPDVQLVREWSDYISATLDSKRPS